MKCYVCFDSDEAGRNGANDAQHILREYFDTENIQIEGQKDFGGLGDSEAILLANKHGLL